MADQGNDFDNDDSEQLVSELIQAIKDGKMDQFIHLFSTAPVKPRHKLANSTNEATKQDTLLIRAIEANHLQLCHFLLDNGADVNLGNASGMRPLHFAADRDVDFEIMEYLLQNGADPNVKNMIFATPLHDVCDYYQPEKTKILLKYRADVNFSDQMGNQPLHLAAKVIYDTETHKALKAEDIYCDCVNIVKLLIEAGANVNAQGRHDSTALHHAALNNCSHLVAYLLDNGASVNACDNHGDTPCQHIILQQHMHSKILRNEVMGDDLYNVIETERVLVMLLNKGSNINHANLFGETLLHKAATTRAEVIDLIIKYGGDKNVKNNLGRNALHVSVLDSPSMSEERLLQIKQMCKDLISHGISVNEADINGSTPLHHALNMASLDLTEMLIGEGADVNIADKCGTVPLHIAMTWNDEGMSFAQLLLSNGADMKAVDVNGSTIAHYAAWYTAGLFPFAADFLVSQKVDMQVEDNRGNTPVDLAAFIYNNNFLEELQKCYEDCASHSDRSFNDISDNEDENSLADEMEIEESESETESESDNDVPQPNNVTPIKTEDMPVFVEQFKSYHKQSIKYILKNPYFDTITNSEEAKYVRENVHELVQHILNKIAENDPRFEAEAILSGSVNEGAKIFLPDEFDYICCLHKFDDMTIVNESDPNQPPCFVSLSMNDKGQSSQSKRHEYIQFFSGSYLDQNSVSSSFYQLIRKVIPDPNIWSNFPRLLLHKEPQTDKGKIQSLTVKWRGYLIKDMLISIDFVPAIPKRKWQPSQITATNPAINKCMQSLGCLLVTKIDNTKQTQFETEQRKSKFLRISFSEIETHLLKTQNEEVRLGYKLAKHMIGLVPPLCLSDDDAKLKQKASELISSYMLKTCLFHLIEKNTNSGPLIDEQLPFREKIQAWTFLIYDQLENVLASTDGGVLPSYFVAEYNLISLEEYSSYGAKDKRRLLFSQMIKKMMASEKILNKEDMMS